tara:strand:+ start:543 stop:695 length:153 start_codon:yes stop_codon:yes gene_type:complete
MLPRKLPDFDQLGHLLQLLIEAMLEVAQAEKANPWWETQGARELDIRLHE